MKVWRGEPEATPASVGMDAAGLDAIVSELESTLAEGRLFHGAQLAVFRRGACVLEAGGGLARVSAGQPVGPESLFVLYSATKGLAGLALLMLYERGAFHYDEPVVKYWPEFASAVPEKAGISIRHVLSHRAGFPLGPRWLDADHWSDPEAIRRAMIEIPLRSRPGEKNAYHALNQGHVIDELCERIDGRRCGRFLREEVFDPLGVDDLHLGLPEDPALESRVAWCYNDTALSSRSTGLAGPAGSEGGGAEAAPARPLEHLEREHEFNRLSTWRAGLPAAGGIGSARALASVYAVLARGGSDRGVKLVTADGLAQVTTPTNRADEIDGVIGFPIRWGLGFHVGTHGRGSSLATFGHAGMGGQIGFADPDRELAFAFTTNGELDPDFLRWRYRLQGMAFSACAD